MFGETLSPGDLRISPLDPNLYKHLNLETIRNVFQLKLFKTIADKTFELEELGGL
jgi:hypothetical protein